MDSFQVEIIVCTRNRSDVILTCIESLINARRTFENECAIVVVDNDSDDETLSILGKSDYSSQIFVCSESRVGLSYARNKGVELAQTPWVCYVDDDAVVHNDFVEQLLWTIRNSDFDCFGGVYNAWYRYGQKPRWLPADFGTNRNWLPHKSGVLPDGKYFSGGVCVFKVELLNRIGGFPTNLGMAGNRIAYGEEVYVQKRIKEDGGIIGFNPALQIDHEVRKEKLRFWWHLKSSYARGRDSINSQEPISLFSVIKASIRLPFKLVLDLNNPTKMYVHLTEFSHYMGRWISGGEIWKR